MTRYYQGTGERPIAPTADLSAKEYRERIFDYLSKKLMANMNQATDLWERWENSPSCNRAYYQGVNDGLEMAYDLIFNAVHEGIEI